MNKLFKFFLLCSMFFILTGCFVDTFAETYVVIFDSKGGTNPNKQNVSKGSNISTPTTTREGYTIEGWYTSLDGGLTLDEKWSFASSFVNSNLTLYANWTINQYTIIFYSDEVIDIDPIIQDYDSKIVLPTLSKEGYVFLGWFEDDEYNKEFTLTTMPSKDLTLFAKWEINQYTVNFESNGGTPVDSISQDYNSIIEKPSDPTREGYTFDGWFLDEDLTEPFLLNTMPSEDFTIYAKWTINEYEISFETYGGDEIKPIIQEYGTNFSLPIPIKEGYSFLGWFEDNSFTKEFESSTFLAKDIVLHAMWKENLNEIIFDANGGIGEMPNQIVLADEVNNLSKNGFSRKGYNFIGWSTSLNGDVEYLDEDSYTTRPNLVYTLYAKWEAASNKLIFDANCGFGYMAHQLIKTEDTQSLKLNEYIYEGYTFIGWSTEQNGEVQYLDGSIYSMGTDASYTLYAKWESNTNEITFQPNGGTGEMTNQKIKTNEVQTLYPNEFFRVGFTFVGWSVTPDGEIEFLDKSIYKMGPNSIYNLYAVWKIEVKFVVDGGIEIPSSFGNPGDPISRPIDPQKDSYAFIGWFVDVEFTKPFSFECFPDKSITLYAKWLFNKDNTLLIGEKGVTYTIPTGADDSGTAQVSGGFLMAKTETSYELWYEVRVWAEYNGYFFQNIGREGHDGIIGAEPTDDRFEPVTTVSWRDCIVWCNAYSEYMGFNPVYQTSNGIIIRDSRDENADKLNLAMQIDSNGYRLPTSYEWEMAARWRNTINDGLFQVGGRYWTPGSHASGANEPYYSDETARVSWYMWNSSYRTHEVALKKANDCGIFDMSGNVDELCFDTSLNSIHRGGSYYDNIPIQLGEIRNSNSTFKDHFVGFRVVRTLFEEIDGLVGQKGVTYTIPTGADDSGTAQVSGGFLMAKTETSYELWYEVRVWAEYNGYFFQNIGREGHDGIIGAEPTDDRFEPVTTVSWRDCIVWCNAYSEYTSLEPVYRTSSGEIIKDSREENAQELDSAIQTDYNGYRLPTSLEWEMAARWRNTGGEGSILIENRFWTLGNHASGAKDFYYNYNETSLVAWYEYNSEKGTHQVATKKENDIGLYDMSGNVYEWCFDWHPIYVGTNRILRGGGYGYSRDLQVGIYVDDNPYRAYDCYGFRIVRNLN